MRGDALDRAGRRDEARAAFTAVAEAARAIGDHRALAEAALGYKGLAVTVTTPDDTAVALIGEALDRVGDDEPALRARLLAASALESYYADPDAARRCAAEAVQLARGARDPATLAHTLSAQHLALWDGDHVQDRLGVAGEMARVARAARDRVALLQARNWRVIDLLELSKIDDAEEEMRAYAGEAAELRLARFEWYVPLWGACLGILRGDWEVADELSRAAHEQGVAAGDGNAERYRLIQHTFWLHDQGRYDEFDLDALERASRESATGRSAWIGWLASMYAELGDEERARRYFDEIARDDFALLHNDANWHSATDFAECAARLGTPDQADGLRKRLARYERLNPVMGRGIGCLGPFAYFLGRLATRAGDVDEAVRLFTWAEEACERMGAKPRAEMARARRAELGGDQQSRELAPPADA